MTLKQLIDFDVLSFDVICDKIRKGEHFSLARYGDGEFNAILGKQGANCDGHEYFPEMGNELADTLRSKPEYFIGLHQNAKLQEETLDWLAYNNVSLNLVSNAVFHCAIRDGLFDQFWEALKGKNVVVIGPEYLKKQTKIHAGYVTIPASQTYYYWKTGTSNIDYIKNFPSVFKGKVVLICASMTAPLIIDHLYRQYGNTATFIDFGSSFDPYCGIKSRSFHKSAKQ